MNIKNDVDITIISYRDPAGHLISYQNRIIRLVKSEKSALNDFLLTKTANKYISSGNLVKTFPVKEEEINWLLKEQHHLLIMDNNYHFVEHELIPFPSFPHEWPAEMLFEAGILTLDLARDMLLENFGLKDATPFNILFNGYKPVFVDVLSMERRDSNDPVWIPYAQFVRTFLLPLLVNKYFGIEMNQIFITKRDGLQPEEVYKMCSLFQRLNPVFLSLVSVPTWITGRNSTSSIYKKRTINDTEKTQFILNSLFSGLRKNLYRLKPKARSSAWTDYVAKNNNYTIKHFEEKEKFVREFLYRVRSKKVLDIGCNTGHFSIIAAESGASVVAIDNDSVVVGQLWQKSKDKNLNILPLIINIARPTPNIGWSNIENPSFLDRAKGFFDVVLMLAVMHHLLVSERIPLSEIISLAASVTSGYLIIEFISPKDTMFRILSRGREHLFDYLCPDFFEQACLKYFKIIKKQHADNTERWLYVLQKEI